MTYSAGLKYTNIFQIAKPGRDWIWHDPLGFFCFLYAGFSVYRSLLQPSFSIKELLCFLIYSLVYLFIGYYKGWEQILSSVITIFFYKVMLKVHYSLFFIGPRRGSDGTEHLRPQSLSQCCGSLGALNIFGLPGEKERLFCTSLGEKGKAISLFSRNVLKAINRCYAWS